MHPAPHLIFVLIALMTIVKTAAQEPPLPTAAATTAAPGPTPAPAPVAVCVDEVTVNGIRYFIDVGKEEVPYDSALLSCRLAKSVILIARDFTFVDGIKTLFQDCTNAAGQVEYRSEEPFRVGLNLHYGHGWWADGKAYDDKTQRSLFYEFRKPEETNECQEVFLWYAEYARTNTFLFTEVCGGGARVICGAQFEYPDSTTTDIAGDIKPVPRETTTLLTYELYGLGCLLMFLFGAWFSNRRLRKQLADLELGETPENEAGGEAAEPGAAAPPAKAAKAAKAAKPAKAAAKKKK